MMGLLAGSGKLFWQETRLPAAIGGTLLVPYNPRRVVLVFDTTLFVATETDGTGAGNYSANDLGVLTWLMHGPMVTSQWYQINTTSSPVIVGEVLLLPLAGGLDLR